MGIASAMGASVGCCWSPARCISFSRLTRALMIATLGQDLSEPFQLYAPPQKLGVPLPAGSAPVALGRSKPRGEVHRDGDWHRSVHVWLTDGESLLLQRRSAHKDTHPNLLDVSCAGHLSGLDASLETAVKELKEELGFEATEEQLAESFVCTLPTQGKGSTKHGSFQDNEFQDIYLLIVPCEAMLPEALSLDVGQMDEVAGTLIMPSSEVLRRWGEGHSEMVPRPTHYAEVLRRALADRNHAI